MMMQTPTALQSTSGATIVASDTAASKGSFLDTIWNEKTKLWFYLLVWYGGNVKCKSPFFNEEQYSRSLKLG